MATYTTLKTRIITETHRSDLSTDFATVLDQHVADAVAEFAHERFYFNTVRTTANTVASTATVALPSGVRIIDRVFYDGELRKVALTNVPEEQSEGVPTAWADYASGIWLDPIPDAIYALTIVGIADVAAPSAGSDDNIWTNQAAKLICKQVQATLFRDVFRDTEQAAVQFGAAQMELRRLKRESARRAKAPMTFDSALYTPLSG